MEIAEYRKTLTKPLKKVTILFPMTENQILLGMKLRGFGMGKWNGFGGKKDPGESMKQAAVRETYEEAGIVISPRNLRRVGTINFYFPEVPKNDNWNQKAFVYIATTWKNQPIKTDEMDPKLFKKDEIPYEQMWKTDSFWLPHILNGQKVKADFLFMKNPVTQDFEVVKHQLSCSV